MPFSKTGEYIKMAEGFVAFLQSINDPRLFFYAALDDNGMISGTPLGKYAAMFTQFEVYNVLAPDQYPCAHRKPRWFGVGNPAPFAYTVE